MKKKMIGDRSADRSASDAIEYARQVSGYSNLNLALIKLSNPCCAPEDSRDLRLSIAIMRHAWGVCA